MDPGNKRPVMMLESHRDLLLWPIKVDTFTLSVLGTAVATLALTCGGTCAIFAGANFTSAIWVSAVLFDFDWSTLAL
jgi:hypothetical protein